MTAIYATDVLRVGPRAVRAAPSAARTLPRTGSASSTPPRGPPVRSDPQHPVGVAVAVQVGAHEQVHAVGGDDRVGRRPRRCRRRPDVQVGSRDLSGAARFCSPVAGRRSGDRASRAAPPRSVEPPRHGASSPRPRPRPRSAEARSVSSAARAVASTSSAHRRPATGRPRTGARAAADHRRSRCRPPAAPAHGHRPRQPDRREHGAGSTPAAMCRPPRRSSAPAAAAAVRAGSGRTGGRRQAATGTAGSDRGPGAPAPARVAGGGPRVYSRSPRGPSTGRPTPRRERRSAPGRPCPGGRRPLAASPASAAAISAHRPAGSPRPRRSSSRCPPGSRARTARSSARRARTASAYRSGRRFGEESEIRPCGRSWGIDRRFRGETEQPCAIANGRRCPRARASNRMASVRRLTDVRKDQVRTGRRGGRTRGWCCLRPHLPPDVRRCPDGVDLYGG